MRAPFMAIVIAGPLALLSVGTHAADAPSAADQSFVRQAAAGGLAEVQDGQLAQQRSTNSDITKFAGQMVTDHTQANDELKQVAQAKGISIPAHPTAAQRHAELALAKVSGKRFDHHYAAQQVQDHETTVALFQKEADSGHDADLKAFAQKYLPILQHHLEMAKALPTG